MRPDADPLYPEEGQVQLPYGMGIGPYLVSKEIACFTMRLNSELPAGYYAKASTGDRTVRVYLGTTMQLLVTFECIEDTGIVYWLDYLVLTVTNRRNENVAVAMRLAEEVPAAAEGGVQRSRIQLRGRGATTGNLAG